MSDDLSGLIFLMQTGSAGNAPGGFQVIFNNTTVQTAC
jgi:hypothetical protein